MRFVVHPAGAVPIYRQLMRQIEDAIANGRLAAGAQLPSHRELSEQLVIAPLTVKKAYDELEARGYLETQRGRGTFVRDGAGRRDVQTVARAAQVAALRESVKALLAQARAAGMDADDITALVQQLAPTPIGSSAKPSRRVTE